MVHEFGHLERNRAGFGAFLLFVACVLPLSRAQEPLVEVRAPDEDPKLGERLIRKAVKGGEDDVMERIAELMSDAARRLEVQLDATAETQSVQKNVLGELDRAIKVAASRRRPKPQPQTSSSSDRREGSKQAPKDKPSMKGKTEIADAPTEDQTRQAEATPAPSDLVGGALKESRRSWGTLPDRERDEIIQGLGEGYVEKYRAWIEKYYRALQENDH